MSERVTFVLIEDDNTATMSLSHYRALLAERDRLRDALHGTLAALVAMTSLIIRAEDAKKQPSKVVASDSMFRQMLVDYDNATTAARAALKGDTP